MRERKKEERKNGIPYIRGTCNSRTAPSPRKMHKAGTLRHTHKRRNTLQYETVFTPRLPNVSNEVLQTYINLVVLVEWMDGYCADCLGCVLEPFSFSFLIRMPKFYYGGNHGYVFTQVPR